MEELKLILTFLDNGDHFVGFIVAMAVFFAGVGYVVRGFRKKQN